MPLNGLRHDFAIGVAGHADEAGHFLFSRFKQSLERAIGRFDLSEVVRLAKAVDVEQVHMIDAQPLQAAFQPA